MGKYAFIPSRSESSKNKQLEAFLTEAGFKVEFLINQKSIFEAFANACKSIKAKDTVIFCHDDIRILNDSPAFNGFLEKELNDPDVGFVGVAGARVLGNNCMWWDGLEKTDGFPRHSGLVWHGNRIKDMTFNFYGVPSGNCVVLDGLFLAAKGRTVNTIQLTKPKTFKGDWDFYDIFYTFQAFLKGLHNRAIPIQILHSSKGDLKDRDSWFYNREAFYDIFRRQLPASCLA